MIKIGIIGYGVVGENTAKIFDKFVDQIHIRKYDKFKVGKWDSVEMISSSSDFIFIALPTPMKKSGEIDLTYIESTLKEISNSIGKNKPIVIIRSTSVPGSCDQYAVQFPNLEIAFVPEFLTEKNPWDDTINATRVVIGTDLVSVFFAIKSLFQIFYLDSVKYIHMTRSEAEMYKYACNYFLSMSVLAANELYFICKSVGVDYQVIQQNLKFDKRIGTFTQVPGHDNNYGIGGKCFPKDINALFYLGKKAGYNGALLKTAIDFNLKIRENHDWLNIPGAISDCKYKDGDE